MHIAVVGAGISGLAASYLLARHHAVTLYEQDGRLGGHAHTHDVRRGGATAAVDTGFMVFNERTYPAFTRLLDELGVPTRETDMSFSVRCRRCELEFSSAGLRGLFAQRSRLRRAGHWRLLADIRRFFRLGRRTVDGGDDRRTLGQWLDEGGFGDQLARHFVLPMGGAIWSASRDDLREFPVLSYLRFMHNHGLLAASGQPRWRTIPGGSRTYVNEIARRLGGTVRTESRVAAIVRCAGGVRVGLADGGESRHDAVVVATHADQALALLNDASPSERDALSRFRYSTSQAWLHADAAQLPTARDARASWNCDVADCRDGRAAVSVTYDLARLQGHGSGPPLLCSLNPVEAIRSEVHARMAYAHPVLDGPATTGQDSIRRLNGQRRTWFCGAHMGYGFHEDGLRSAMEVARGLGVAC